MAWWNRFTQYSFADDQFPSLGEPLKRHDNLWQSHIKQGNYVGQFGEVGWNTQEEALEESANKINYVRTLKRIKRISNRKEV